MENRQTPAKSKFFTYLMKNKLSSFLILVVIIVVVGAFVKITIDKHHFKNEMMKMQLDNQHRYNQLQLIYCLSTTKTFSWALRSELMRQNKEQANVLVSEYIKERMVQKVFFVDANSNRISLASDKKDEGAVFTQPYVILSDSITQSTVNSIHTVNCPIMGLNTKLGVLVVQFNLE